MSNRLYTSIKSRISAFALKAQRALLPIYAPIINAGTAGLSDEAAKRVVIVNSISFITALLAFVIGNLFYVYTGLAQVQIPAIIESVLFCGIILLNRYRLYSIASVSVLVVHCACAVYFGILLGQLINISLIAVFMFGMSFLVYSKPQQQIVGICATLLTLFLLELNFYYKLFPSLQLAMADQYLLRWVALPCFLLFDVIVMLYYVRENKALYNRLKMFVYKVSHEIRNQLNAMALVAQLIKREIKLDDHLKKIEPYVDLLLTAVNNMRNVINNVLDVAQIEAGKEEEVEEDTFALRSLIQKIINLNKVSARSRGLQLSLSVAPDVPDVLVTDTLKLTMIVTNLLGNAIKYADKNSEVKLQIHRSGNNFVMTFSNECPDISAERQAVLFDSYTTDKKSRHIEGTGLGLYITRSKVDSLGGKVKLSSEGGHTSFTVTLPLKEGHTPDIEEEVTEADIDLSNIHILLADDNEMNNMLFSKYLTLYGCNVTCTTSGREAMEHLKKTRHLPEIIILDHQMPELDGEQTLLLLKKHAAFKHIPVLICTGGTQYEKPLMAAGAAAVILKPINPRFLFKVISQHLPHIDEVNTGSID
ncbi:response regulator [Chitinophaga agrisoli]|uniref:histidine kinase n=1 Tax=Chitinophaga agrisoli TaxID=2607653 RepID=A0A5B2VI01_9BACT|nr:hybrid sensor histidine kinase/response regulator [Chitinophaga agrisoli]KAA2239213.1 response regulator [Chitinophaga agrisoli]